MRVSRSADSVDPLDSGDPVRSFRRAHDDGLLLSLATSGTTAHPRRVLRTTDSWTRSFGHVTDLTGLDDTSRVWVPGPISATMNLFARVHADAVGATLVEDSTAATHAHLTPLALDRALRDELLRDETVVIVAGDRLPDPVLERARAAGLTVHQYYGAAELSFVAWAQDGRTLLPFPQVDVFIVDDVIWATSPYLCKGYDGPDQDGSLRWNDDGAATVGDLGALDNGVLTVRGRGGDAVTVAGVTVLVADVEDALSSHAAGRVQVTGLADERLGAALVAAVTDPLDFDRLRDVAHRLLTPAQRPSRWYVVDELPVTAAGKPDRVRLQEMLAALPPTRVAR